MLPSIKTLLAITDEYCRLTKRARGTVGLVIFDDGKKFAQLANGAQITVERYNRAMQWLSDNWPVDKAWPEQFERPSPSPRPLPSDEGASGGGAVSHGGTDE